MHEPRTAAQRLIAAASLSVALLLAGCEQDRTAPASKPDEPALVSVMIHQKPNGKDVYIYGWVEEADLKRFTLGSDVPKFIKIYHEYWFDTVGAVMLEDDYSTGVNYCGLNALEDITCTKTKGVEDIRKQEQEADIKRKKAKELEKQKNEKKELIP
jgi:hypothetical protein